MKTFPLLFSLVALSALASCARPAAAPELGATIDAEAFFGSEAAAAKTLALVRSGSMHCASFFSSLDAVVCAEASSLEGHVAEERAGWLRALEQLRAAHDASDVRLAWFSAHRLAESTTFGGPLTVTEAASVDALARDPRGLGWRAALELRILRRDGLKLRGVAARGAVGCLTDATVIGPVPRNHAPAAEELARGPFPRTLPAELGQLSEARVATSEGCELPMGNASEASPSFLRKAFAIDADRTVIVAVSRATKLFVDGVLVVERSPSDWGSWSRFGARLRLRAGVHRIAAEVVGAPAALFVLDEDGQPAPVKDAGSDEAYVLAQPQVLAGINPLEALVAAAPVKPHSRVDRFVSSELALADGLSDVASFWLDGPASAEASPAWLRAQGRAAASDAIYTDEDRDRRSLDFFARLGKACATCVDPRIAHARTQRDGGQVVAAWKSLEALADEVPERLDVVLELADLAERLGWDGERTRISKLLALRFPSSPAALRVRLATVEAVGPVQDAPSIVKQLVASGAAPTLERERALRVRDWAHVVPAEGAKTFVELDALRMAGLLPRFHAEAAALLEHESHPLLRLTLAEEHAAQGDGRALADALESAAKAGEVRDRLAQAVAVVDSVGALGSYRIDARKVLADFDRSEKGTFDTSGPSSRILDYAVLWVDARGSAHMLEHEMVRIQSREAIQQEAEQPFPAGRILRLAVRKPDGRVLEPDVVQGKSTLTMPELAIGDVVETEHIQELGTARPDGTVFQSPRWYFREPDKSYWRSEYVVVTEAAHPLSFDERGAVPARVERTLADGRIETRWRVDGAPAVRDEPAAPPRSDWLPSVQVTYGLREDEELGRTVERLAVRESVDPRVRAIADSIVAGVPTDHVTERLRKLHAYCLDHIEDGSEAFGPRVLTSGSGQRTAAFLHLAHILRIPVETTLARTKTGATWPSEGGRLEAWGGALLRAETENGVRWLTVSERYADFDWLPEVMRGQETVRLVQGLPRERIPPAEVRDAFVVQGTVDVDDDGTVQASLELRFRDRPAMAFRAVRARTDDSEWRRFLEQGLLVSSFPSWHTESLETEGGVGRDGDLVVRVRGSAPFWLDGRGSRRCPFTINLRPYVALESRQTPLVVDTPTGVHLQLRVRGGRGAKPRAPGPARTVETEGGIFRVADRMEGDTLVLDRMTHFAPQRVSAEAYPAWATTLREGLAIVEREFSVTLPARR